MSTPLAKRRRLDNATATLSKPFRSPLKTPLKQTAEPTTSTKPIRALSTDEKVQSGPNESKAATPSLFARPRVPLRSPHTISKKLDPELMALLKKQRELERTLTDMHAWRDTLLQAQRIETASSDAELESLVSKWRTASQQAAEEVFKGVRDRVNRMGGVGAWRDSMRRRQEMFSQWDEEDRKAARNGEDNNDEDTERLDQYADDGQSPLDEEPKERNELLEGDDDETFSLDMMLKSLNIELDIIGYDKTQRRWTT